MEFMTINSKSLIQVMLTNFIFRNSFLFFHSSQALLWEAILLLLLATFNVVFACWDTYLRQTEMHTRIEWLRNFVEEWKDKCDWRPENYPHIHCPQSPSITLQPTMRDGIIVNLPWALLVKGDVIILRPGQPAPGRCRKLKVLIEYLKRTTNDQT